MSVTIHEPGERVARLTLPIELTNGNDGRGSRWFSSAKVRKGIEALLRGLGYVCQPLDYPVIVHVTRVLGPRQSLWDSSSCGRGSWKECEDALVACGWFHDDGPKWIVETRFFQDPGQRTVGPATVVEIFRVKE